MAPREDSERHVNRLLDAGNVRGALEMATRLIERGSVDVDFALGTIYERGGGGVSIDLGKAARFYARAAFQTPCDITSIYLARVQMKLGNFDLAKRWILDAETYGTTARIELGWAWFHEHRPEPDLPLAKRHFLKAARKGRFLGFQGYARVARSMGQPLRALAVDSLRITTGPFIALIIGRRAREAF